MEFENKDAEQAYKEIVNTSGVAFYEIVSRAEEYDKSFRENDELRPEDLDRNDQGLRALEVLSEAGLLMQDGDRRTYEIIEDPEVYGEVFGKIADLREPLVEGHD
ncbi:MAG: hypothetical protein ABEJ87_02375 [Candidatus Nanohalobium sp.]